MPRDSQTNFSFPTSQLSDVTRDLSGGYTLIANDGRIWTSAPDGKQAHQMLKRAVESVEPQGVTG